MVNKMYNSPNSELEYFTFAVRNEIREITPGIKY